jgi:hypothetical protein
MIGDYHISLNGVSGYARDVTISRSNQIFYQKSGFPQVLSDPLLISSNLTISMTLVAFPVSTLSALMSAQATGSNGDVTSTSLTLTPSNQGEGQGMLHFNSVVFDGEQSANLPAVEFSSIRISLRSLSTVSFSEVIL